MSHAKPEVGQAAITKLEQEYPLLLCRVTMEQALALGKACREAIEESERVILVSSHSLSHRHFVTESLLPEDMSREHHNQPVRLGHGLIKLFRKAR